MTGSDVSDPPPTFDWTEFESPAVAVVAYVAAQLGADVQSIELLSESVDPDALENILTRSRGSRRSPSTRVEFDYQGFRIALRSDGTGCVVDRDGDRSANADPSDSGCGGVED